MYDTNAHGDLMTPIHFQAPATVTKAWIEKDEETGSETRKIEMLASGTQIDAYGDRMSENAIHEMAEGMIGKDFLPDHRAEWMDVLGVIIDSRVDEKTSDLYLTAMADPIGQSAQELVDTLFSAIDKGRTVGVSIAGWIKRVMFETDNETGREVRVIDSITSDHTAATRTPAYQPAHITGFKSLIPIEDCVLPYLFKSLDDAGLKSNDMVGIDIEEKTESDLDKKAVSPKKYPLADESQEWSFVSDDGNAIIDMGGWTLYKNVHAWFDDEQGNVPEIKSAYKLPHHKIIDGSVKTVWRGVSSAMSALLGGRGGVSIPSTEREAVYTHLKSHYNEFDKSIPDFKDIEPTLIRWDEYINIHTLSDEDKDIAIDRMLSGGIPDCLNKEEIFDMDAKELAEVLKGLNEEQKTEFADVVSQAVSPMAETMKAIAENMQGMSEILAKQSAPVTEVVEETVIEEIEDPSIARIAALESALEKATARITQLDEASQPIGVSTASQDEDDSDVEKSFLEQLSDDLNTEKAQALKRKNPGAYLRHLINAFSDEDGYNHLFDIIEDQGGTSPMMAKFSHQARWSKRS